jgi:3-mercaptopyruvate sulfurtransferase SseA
MPELAIPTVTVAELRSVLADPARGWWLVHATDRAGFHEGHIPGALARPSDTQLHRLGRTARILVYGEDEHAVAAPTLTAALHRLGVEAAWFAGGLAAWTEAGLTIQRSG